MNHEYTLPLDPRTALMVGSRNRNGTVNHMTPEQFASPVATWPISPATPPEVANLLQVSQRLYTHGAFVYEFITVAVHQALIALEAALAIRLNRPKDGLGDLLKRAHRNGLLTAQAIEMLDAGRELRNGFSHARDQQVWSPGMAAPVIHTIHTIIATLWEPQA